MSSFNVKPGVDWSAIKADFDAGLSLAECVRRQCERGVSITKRAIQKRRDKEGWDTASAMALATERLPSVIAQSTGQSISRIKTAETAQAILKALRDGLNYGTACARANVSRSAFDQWRDTEPEFRELCEQAQALAAADRLDEIKSAGARDWKASAYLVERNPATKADYATKESGGTIIQVNVAVDRAAPDTVTVEHKP